MVRRVEFRTPVPDDGMNRLLGSHRDRRVGTALAGQPLGKTRYPAEYEDSGVCKGSGCAAFATRQ
jgi:hypothetical protein